MLKKKLEYRKKEYLRMFNGSSTVSQKVFT